MKTKPILFSTEMVQAILDNRKTMTRRICKRQPLSHQVYTNYKDGTFNINGPDFDSNDIKCPYGSVGDVLWVRETFQYTQNDHCHDLLEGIKDRNQYVYKASVHEDFMIYAKEKYGYNWKPSLFMPKEACRIFLKITNIRVERLNDISDKDAIKEGVKSIDYGVHWKNYIKNEISCFIHPKHSFESLWESINGKESVESNPWVWVIEFERCEKPENW